jgi:hypothetical protein
MKNKFPYIALGIGLLLSLVIMKGSQLNEDGTTLLPLFTLLIICEISFFITTIGAYMSIMQILNDQFKLFYLLVCIACILLALQFLISGIKLWPN